MENKKEKWEKLFNLSKEIYKEEIDRFLHIDNKASRYISVITILFGLTGIVFKISFIYFFKFEDKFDYMGAILVSIFIILLALGWLYSFRAIKIQQYRGVTLNDKWIKFYWKERLIDIYYGYIKRFKNAISLIAFQRDRKATFLKYSYNFVMYSILALILTFALIGYKYYSCNYSDNFQNKEGVKIMKDEGIINNDSGDIPDEQPDSSDDGDPNVDVEPPQFGLVTAADEDPHETKIVVENESEEK